MITDPWLPVRTAAGESKHVSPSEIVEGFSQDPIVDFEFSRQDFRASAVEFVVGLLQTAYAPRDTEQKFERLKSPPSGGTLKEFLGRISEAFDVNGDPACFQQPAGLEGKEVPIRTQILDGPGANSEKLNIDVFVKRTSYERLCRTCAALTLITRQLRSPSAGTGYRTSPRGGSALTTLLDMRQNSGAEAPLWQRLYINVLPGNAMETPTRTDKPEFEKTFPWLAPQAGGSRSASDVHPLQLYFPMPHRIRLLWDTAGEEKPPCAICGQISETVCGSAVVANQGIDYVTESIRHPFTPYYKPANANHLLPIQCRGSTTGYVGWLDTVLGDDEGEVARVLSEARQYGPADFQELGLDLVVRLWGYEMDNAKAVHWHAKDVPYFFFESRDDEKNFKLRAQNLTNATREIAGALERYLKNALALSKRTDVASREFLDGGESLFILTLQNLATTVSQPDAEVAILNEWLSGVRRIAPAVFDRHAAINVTDASELRRRVTNRAKFRSFLMGRKLKDMLGLPTENREEAA